MTIENIYTQTFSNTSGFNTFNVTTAGTDRALIAWVDFTDGSSGSFSQDPKFNNVNMTNANTEAPVNQLYTSSWYLLNPTLGTLTFTIGAYSITVDEVRVTVIALSGVRQTSNPFVTGSNNQTSATPSANLVMGESGTIFANLVSAGTITSGAGYTNLASIGGSRNSWSEYQAFSAGTNPYAFNISPSSQCGYTAMAFADGAPAVTYNASLMSALAF